MRGATASVFLTGDAPVVVHRPQAYEQIPSFGKGLNPLHRSIRHVGGALSFPIQERRIRALGYEVFDHLHVSSGSCIVERRHSLVIAGIHIGPTFLHEIFYSGHEPRRVVSMIVRREALTEAGTRGGVKRRHGRPTFGDLR